MTGGETIASIIALVGTGIIGYGGIMAIQLLVRHYSAKSAGALPAGDIEAELRDIRARLDESEQARERIAELEERLDFAERMLAQQREAGRLASGKSES